MSSSRFVRALVLMLFVASGWAQASTPAPDWAERMIGRWNGQGARVDAGTRARTLVEVVVHSEWHPELALPAVVSSNHFKETTLDAAGNPVRVREYDRVYWVRENQRAEGWAELVLGGGTDSSSPVGSRGSYDAVNFLLFVNQDLGGGVRVSSQSDLSKPGVTLYSETFWINGTKRIQSEIRYQREN